MTDDALTKMWAFFKNYHSIHSILIGYFVGKYTDNVLLGAITTGVIDRYMLKYDHTAPTAEKLFKVVAE